MRFASELDDHGLWPDDDDLDRQLCVTIAQAIETIIRKGAA
jgi:hypothetical protein